MERVALRPVFAAILFAAAAVPAHVFAQAEPVPPPPAVGPNGEPLAPPPPAVGPYGQPLAPPPPAVGPAPVQYAAPPPAVYGTQQQGLVAPPPAVTQAQPYPTRRRRLDLHHGRIILPDDGGPVPPGAYRESHMSRGKFIGGIVITGLLWDASIAVAGYCGYLNWAARAADAAHIGTLPTCPGAIDWLYVPVAGPYIAAFSPGVPEWASVLLVIDGAIQTVGFILSLVGVADRQHYFVIDPNHPAPPEAENGEGVPRRRRAVERSYMVAPTASTTGAGLAFAMTF